MKVTSLEEKYLKIQRSIKAVKNILKVIFINFLGLKLKFLWTFAFFNLYLVFSKKQKCLVGIRCFQNNKDVVYF